MERITEAELEANIGKKPNIADYAYNHNQYEEDISDYYYCRKLTLEGRYLVEERV